MTVATRLDRLTSASERAVVEYLLTAGPRAAVMSAQQIAKAAGTSDATVVRAAKSLGYPGLRDLKLAVAEETSEPDLPTRLRATIDSARGASDLLAGAVERQFGALDALVRRISAEDFDRATHTIAKAPRLWWSGIGPSAFLAGYAAFLCNRLGQPSGALTHAGPDHADELVAIQRNDVVIVLAYGRVHSHVRVLLDHAADVGAKVVVITDTAHRRSPNQDVIQLNAGRGTPGLFATHGSTIVLIEALVLAAAAEQPKRSTATLESLNRLRAALAGRRVDVDP